MGASAPSCNTTNMSVTLTQLLTKANNHLKFADTTNYTTAQREDACRSAVKEYSKRRPRYILQSYTATASQFYDLPTSWDQSFSYIQEIEYEVDQTPKETIKQKYYSIDLMSDGYKLRFGNQYPTSGDTFYVKYYGLHSFDSSGDSNIFDADLVGLSYLAASIMCEELATFFASKADGNLPNVEIVEFNTRVDEYTKKSREWLKKYNKEIQGDNSTWDNIDFIDNSYWDRNDQ